MRTRQAVNEPAELFFRDVGPGKVECDRLSLYDTGQRLRSNCVLDAQVNSRPKPLV